MAISSSLQFRLRPKNTKSRSDSSTSRKISYSILLWLVGLSSSFLLVLHYSPNPFTAPPLLLPDSSNSQAGSVCDLGVGRWVREAAETPPQNNRTCSAVPGETPKNCGKGVDHLNWRWKPERCELKRFDPGLFLKMVRGKTMAFVGDSVARNQFESLLCLLSQEETPSSDRYKDRDDRFGTWRFASHNFTLTALWTRFLVRAEQRTIDDGSSSPSGVFDLHVDQVDTTWTEKVVPSTDIVVVSTGRWFFRKNYLYERGTLLGCTFCSNPNTTTLALPFAVGKALNAVLRFLRDDCGVEATLLRTFSPAHFEGGTWDGVGRCSRTRPVGDAEGSAGVYWEISRAQVEEMARMRRENVGTKKKRFGCLDVTRAMTTGADNPWTTGYDDCVHWCFPGPVDLWNDLLLAAMETWW